MLFSFSRTAKSRRSISLTFAVSLSVPSGIYFPTYSSNQVFAKFFIKATFSLSLSVSAGILSIKASISALDNSSVRYSVSEESASMKEYTLIVDSAVVCDLSIRSKDSTYFTSWRSFSASPFGTTTTSELSVPKPVSSMTFFGATISEPLL